MKKSDEVEGKINKRVSGTNKVVWVKLMLNPLL